MFLTSFMISFFFIITSGASTRDVEESEINVDNRIVGGNIINIEQAPYQVLLQYPISSVGIKVCGGAIISTQWLLTVAHCVTSAKDIYIIRAGVSHKQKSEGSIHKASQIIIHGKFVPTITNMWDIALIKVTPEFTFSKTVQAIKLANTVPTNDLAAMTSGYGRSMIGGPIVDQLHQVEVKVVNWQKCEGIYGPSITEQHICAGGGGKGACIGDSGGPLVSAQDKTLIGVLSWVDAVNCSNTPHPDVYSSVPYFRKWIQDNSGI